MTTTNEITPSVKEEKNDILTVIIASSAGTLIEWYVFSHYYGKYIIS